MKAILLATLIPLPQLIAVVLVAGQSYSWGWSCLLAGAVFLGATFVVGALRRSTKNPTILAIKWFSWCMLLSGVLLLIGLTLLFNVPVEGARVIAAGIVVSGVAYVVHAWFESRLS